MSFWAAGAAVASVGYGIYKGEKAKKAAKSALSQRVPYKTPKELLEVMNATKANAQNGYDPTTLSYLTNKNDRAFSQSLDALQRLGGDANSAASLFDQKMQQTFKVGAENSLLNMQNFSKYLQAQQYLAGSRDAEWASQEGMVKDQQQAAQQQRLAANAQIMNGINTGISGYSNYKTGQLFAPPKTVTNQDTFQPIAITNSINGVDTQLPL